MIQAVVVLICCTAILLINFDQNRTIREYEDIIGELIGENEALVSLYNEKIKETLHKE